MSWGKYIVQDPWSDSWDSGFGQRLIQEEQEAQQRRLIQQQEAAAAQAQAQQSPPQDLGSIGRLDFRNPEQIQNLIDSDLSNFVNYNIGPYQLKTYNPLYNPPTPSPESLGADFIETLMYIDPDAIKEIIVTDTMYQNMVKYLGCEQNLEEFVLALSTGSILIKNEKYTFDKYMEYVEEKK